MTGSLRRRLLFALLLSGASILLLLWFARSGDSVPLTAHRTHELPLDGFASPANQVSVTDETVRAEGVDAQGATRLIQSVDAMLASDYRYFSFDVDEVPTVSKLVLTWQGSEGQGSAALPDTPMGRGTIDLAALDAWKGAIESVSLILVPTDYLATGAVKQSAFALRGARFESASWSGSLRALCAEWSAYRPWTGRSNNTGGMELAGGAGASLQAFIVLCMLSALTAAALCFGLPRARMLALPLVIGACAMLALLQIRQLGDRAMVARHAAALAQGPPVRPLAAQPQLAAAADALSRQIDEGTERPRVLVHGSTQFLSEYPTWLLRTQDVATLALPDQLPAQAALTNWLLVLVGNGDWEYSEQTGQLRLGTQHRNASLDIDAGVMKAYRFDAPATSSGEGSP